MPHSTLKHPLPCILNNAILDCTITGLQHTHAPRTDDYTEQDITSRPGSRRSVLLADPNPPSYHMWRARGQHSHPLPSTPSASLQSADPLPFDVKFRDRNSQTGPRAHRASPRHVVPPPSSPFSERGLSGSRGGRNVSQPRVSVR